MSEYFFCDDLSGADGVLLDQEAHHLLHVLRLGKGDQIQLLDGCGTVAMAEIREAQRNKVIARILSRDHQPPRFADRLTIAASPPKGERLKWMIEKLTELGVDCYIPLQTTRTVVDPRHTKMEKLQTTVISAMKQCGRRWLMDIASTATFESLVQRQWDTPTELLIAHPGFAEQAVAWQGRRDSSASRLLLIGPEGGFTDAEVALSRAQGAQPIAWHGSILRTETAAIAFAAILGSSCQPRNSVSTDG